MKQLLIRCRANALYIYIALWSLFKGVAFMLRLKPPFYYPPEFKSLMNAQGFHWLFVIAGLALLIYSLVPYSKRKLTGLLVGIVAGIDTILCLIELEHLYFMGDFGTSIVSNLFILVIIFWTSAHCRKL